MQPTQSTQNQNLDQSEKSALSDKTFGNQHKLPIVPLPNLQLSCSTFMEWCSPLLTEEQKKQTQEAVDRFTRPEGPGEKLHEALLKYARSSGVKSWLDRFWATRYLGRRDQIALNANFTFMFLEQEGVSQIQRAVNTIAQALHYKLELDQQRIPPAVNRGTPLCMNQNKWLFSATRIPAAPLDKLRAPYTMEHPGPSKARHILVFHNGHMYTMDVIGTTGKPYSLEDIEKGLRTIRRKAATRPPEGECVGHLTTKRREHWGPIRKQLLSYDPQNKEALDEIETALFSVTLETVDPQSSQDVTDNLLHGDSGSRWFDKALQFIVFKNGSCGLNIEHCGLDGTTILSLIDTMATYNPAEVMQKSGATTQGHPEIKPVRFVLNFGLKSEIANAAKEFQVLVDSAATLNFEFSEFGAKRIKSLGVSPDAFAQLAYQCAHYATRGKIGATYESIATRTYENGRTEAMRVITPEIFKFVETMSDDNSSDEARKEAFMAAAGKHVARAKQCQAGQAPEQHLWELLNIYNAQKDELGIDEDLTLFDTPGWNIVRHDYLSTSSAPSKNVVYFGFGSTSSECIGIGYVLADEQIRIALSIPKAHEETMVKFRDNLQKAFIGLADLLERTK